MPVGLDELGALVQRGVLTPEEASERASELLAQMHYQGPQPAATKATKATKDNTGKQSSTAAKRLRKPAPLLDGLGAGGRAAIRSCIWKLYQTSSADDLPQSSQGAGAWLREPAHTGGSHTCVQFCNRITVVRRCASCPPKTVLGVERVCGMMWRMDKAFGWKPRVRVADARWDGKHLADNGDDVPLLHGVCASKTGEGKVRLNAPFNSSIQRQIDTEARKGRTPKQIWNDFVEQKWDSLSVDDQRRMSGKDNVAVFMGFTLKQVQKHVERFRQGQGNGFVIETLGELRVGHVRNKRT